MITIEDKLYVTKEINKIIVSYAKTVVLRNLLNEFSFKITKKKKKKKVTDLLEEANFCNGDSNPDIDLKLLDFIYSFLDKLNSKDKTALYYWTINNLYIRYLDELEYTSHEDFDENDSDEVFDYKFGRLLAYKLYDPEATELDDELYTELKNLLMMFAIEVDLSLIDKSTIKYVKEAIESYCI